MFAAVNAGLKGSPFRNLAPMTHKFTHCLSMWPLTQVTGGSTGTEALTIGVPDDFYAVRVGFLNITTTPYTINKIVAVPSTTWSNYLFPTGNAAQVSITTNSAGLDDPQVSYKAGSATSLTVLANATDAMTGITDKPKVSWTDWTPCQSATPDPTTGMRVLMLRCTVPPAQTVTFSNGSFDGYSSGNTSPGSTEINNGMEIWIGGLNAIDRSVYPYAGDSASQASLTSWNSNRICNGRMMAIVQVLTRNEGICIMQAGESKYTGTSTEGQFNNFATRAVGNLNRQYLGKVPFGICNVANGGWDSAHTYGFQREILSAISPSIVSMPSWNANENDLALGYTDPASQTIQWARMLSFINAVRAVGAVPLVGSPTPFLAVGAAHPATGGTRIETLPAYAAAWANYQALVAQGTVPTFNLSTILGLGPDRVDPHYVDSLVSTDGLHPNSLGHNKLVQPFLDAISPMLQYGS